MTSPDTVGLVKRGYELLNEVHGPAGDLLADFIEGIQSQAARIAELEAGLKPFADAAAFWEPIYDDSEIMMKPPAYIERWRNLNGRKATVPQIINGHLRQARSLISEEGA